MLPKTVSGISQGRVELPDTCPEGSPPRNRLCKRWHVSCEGYLMKKEYFPRSGGIMHASTCKFDVSQPPGVVLLSKRLFLVA